MLTTRQAQLLRILQDAEDRGETLNYEDLIRRIGLNSKGNIQRISEGLVQRGFLRRTNRRPPLQVIRRIESIHAGEPKSRHPLVAAIHAHQKANDGASPSIREMQRMMNHGSPGTIHRALIDLEREGAIFRGADARARPHMIEIAKKDPDRGGREK